MSLSSMLSLILFVAVATGTPGGATTTAAASGARFGFRRSIPLMAGLVAGLDSLIKLADDQTKIVPANGPVLTRADLQAQRASYFTIYERLVKCLTQGLGPAEALATDPAKGINTQWGDSQTFLTMAFKSLWGHLAADA